jgi:ubiquinone/menaquinone biosynthesis C-methylase UbiE
MKKTKLYIGCGKDAKRGYVNLDCVKLPNVDVIHNLDEYPWPFEDNRFEIIYCANVLEHLSSIVDPLEEIWRISKNSAKIIIKVPISPGIGASADPTHKQFYSYFTFTYFTPDDLLNYYSKARFKIIKRRIIFHQYLKPLTWFFNLNEKIQKFHSIFLAFLIPAYTLYCELEVIKK